VRDYGRAVLEALGEVEDALVRERKQQELIVSLEKQLALSGQVIGRIRDSYINGAVDYLRVLDVVLRHQALQRELLFARRELIGHRIDLCRALGTGWEMNRPGLATP
jgi:outer membrane protein TolC